MNTPDKLNELVELFKDNIDDYKNGIYNETQVRREFIDPLFELLGWDVANKLGYAAAYKQVVHEDAVKIGGATKAPDYSFRIGGTRKFFLEAKKPSVNIKEDIHPAYQLRRYAWSAKLPLSILTDFEEFAVYDCRIKPAKTDKASNSRIMYLNYSEYAENWKDLINIFSPDAIMKGSFDRYITSRSQKRGTAEVDDEFLAEIEKWREELARNIALRNPGLSQREMNFAVQRTIDRIIFLRICEDRGVEDYGRLMALQNGTGIYKRLFDLFRQADDRYNSGLFHFTVEKGRKGDVDSLTPGLLIDDDVLKGIFKNLYYPDSPYEFSVLSADILGQVYERFLGKVIRLTQSHRAIVEEKPEVRKAGGVYYTPTYIVNYIVKQTVGKLLEGKKPGKAALKILDPACGSGSFLLGAYQYLLDWHRDKYIGDGPEKYTKGKNPAMFHSGSGEWRLTIYERKRILLESIYGVDIDPQAVEVTKLSLLLKVLEGEDIQTIGKQTSLLKERVLPDLALNIKCGNSLIGPDFYEGRQTSLMDEEEEEIFRINAFDWENEFREIMSDGGFDAVIGNPPYDVIEKERGKSSWPHAILRNYIDINNEYENALGGKLNLYRFFIVKAINLTRLKGRYAMIIPLSLVGDISTSNLRKHLFQMTTDLEADCFPQKDISSKRVFKNAKLSTAIITCTKNRLIVTKEQVIRIRIYSENKFEEKFDEALLYYSDLSLIDPINIPIPLVNSQKWTIIRKIYLNKSIIRLGDESSYQINRGEINQTLNRKYITSDSKCIKFLKGVEIGRYHENVHLSQGVREWFNEGKYLKDNNKRGFESKIRIAAQRITGIDEKLRIVATIIDPPAYFADSTNSIILSEEFCYGLEYLLGLLNSKLFQWLFKSTSTNNNVSVNELKNLPFKILDTKKQNLQNSYQIITDNVKEIRKLYTQLERQKTPEEQKQVQRRIEALDARIDRLVYELYGLTEEEIKIIEQ